MIILVIQVNDFYFRLVDAERKPPVFRNRQAPSAFSVAGQPMRPPIRNCLKLVFLFHVLKEGNYTSELRRDSRLYAGDIIILDEPAQAPMKHISNFHNLNYQR